jgi:hypothetical protein
MSGNEEAYDPFGDEPRPAEELDEDAPARETADEGGPERAPETGGDEADEEQTGGSEEGGSRVQAHVDHAERSNINMAQTMIQYLGAAGAGAWPSHREMTREDFDVLPADGLYGLQASLVVHEEAVAPVLECMEAHRLALVVGERGLGKGALCRYAAARVAERDPSVEELLVAGRLERELRWRPERFCGEDGDLAHRILVFEDALEEGNRDAARFVERLDEARVQGLQGALQDSGTYLLLSFDVERFPGRREKLSRLGVLAGVEPPSSRHVSQALHRRLAGRRIELERNDPELFEAAEGLLEERGEWLAIQLRTYPRAVRFADELLLPVARGELTLEQAVDRLEDLEYWLLAELPEDSPLWCFVLALVLASTDARFRWVPWLPFHRLWRSVERAIAGEIRDGDEEGRPFRDLSRLVVDRRFLVRARSEARRLPYPAGEAVRFVDPIMAERLWRLLLGPGRALLATLVPRLEDLTRDDDLDLRSLAARALGRAGRMEPRAVSGRWIKRWLTPKSADAPVLLGEMLGASLAAEDPEYAAGCFEEVRRAAASGKDSEASPAFFALAIAGRADPERVLRDLRKILTERIAPRGESAGTPASWIYSRIEAEAKKRASSGPDPMHPTVGQLEAAASAFLGPKGAVVLDGSRYTLAGLCFGGNPLLVLAHLADWMAGGGPAALAPWAAFLVLRDGGMLRLVERFPVRATPGDETADGAPDRPKAWSRILLAADDEEDVAGLATFVEAAFAACEPFPGRLRMRLRENLLGVLGGWARSAEVVSALRPRAVSLFSRLLETPEDELKKAVFDMLRAGDFEKPEQGAPEPLGMEVLRHGLGGGGRANPAN